MKCHAKNCEELIPSTLLMCGKHWRMVPSKLKNEVWRHYRKNQEQEGGPVPTRAYHKAAHDAIETVAMLESGRATELPGHLGGNEKQRARARFEQDEMRKGKLKL